MRACNYQEESELSGSKPSRTITSLSAAGYPVADAQPGQYFHNVLLSSAERTTAYLPAVLNGRPCQMTRGGAPMLNSLLLRRR